MTTTLAAVARVYGAPLSLETVQLRAPAAGEIEVAIEACAICHSDLISMDGGWGGTLPAVFGHEAAGRVSKLGAGVEHLDIGDPVLVTLIRSCASCGTCASGHPVACEAPIPMQPPISVDGADVRQGMNCGAFAGHVIVQTNQIARIPADMPMDVASLLACGVITGVGAAVNAAQVRPGQTVVVIGAGGVGLNAIQGVRIAGARRIIAVDVLDEKLEAARAFGATDVVRGDEVAPWDAVREIGGGRLADAVLVTVGAITVYNDAPKYLSPRGKLVMVGMPPIGANAEYDPSDVANAGQRFIGTRMGDTVLARDIPWLIDLYQQGRLQLDELISERWPLEQINEAIAASRTGSARRTVVTMT